MKELHLYDVSSLVYSGNFSVTYADRKIGRFPISGILHLFRYLSVSLGDGHDVALIFDAKRSFRKDIDDGYKSGRDRVPEVLCQRKFLQDVLPKCGIACYSLDSYEADDIVSWYVDSNVGKYHNIVIYSNDKDLAHNIQDGVILHGITSGSPTIFPANFINSVVRGEKILYNTISAYKTFCGCSSDKIPAFRSENGITGKELYQKYCDYLLSCGGNVTFNQARGFQCLAEFLINSNDLTENDKDELAKRINLVFPAFMPEDAPVLEKSAMEDINRNLIGELLSAMHDNGSLKCLDIMYHKPSEEFYKLINSYSDSLCNGEFSVDNDVPVIGENQLLETESLDFEIMELNGF